MLERIRDTRASEKRMYLQVRDIFALAAEFRRAGRKLHRYQT